MVIFSCVLLGRLFFMQVMDNQYAVMAKNNAVEKRTIYPSRGLIMDRNGRLVVNNEAVYDLVMIPRQVKSLDTTKLCELLAISKQDFEDSYEKMRQSKGYSRRLPQVLFKQIPANIYAKFQEYLYQFPGFYTQVRAVRNYPYRNAAHTLGYIGEVSQQIIDKNPESYRMGDYIGISGIEKTYENQLRGEKGYKEIIVDVHNREIGSYMDGQFDKDAVGGQNLQMTIDIDLQSYAEELMQNKKGGLVAIEPATGEILALVTAPAYDPNLLTGRKRGSEMELLKRDTLKPLFNRALMAKYPPGSTFKPLMALIALEDGAIHAGFGYGCAGGYRLSASKTVGCHGHSSAYNVKEAIKHSCNAYFCQCFYLFLENRKYKDPGEGLTSWHDYLNAFGLGVDLPVDIPNALAGYVPRPDLYNRMYGENRWRSKMIISLGIGQGELGVTPLQLAHMTAVIANKGEFYFPHVVRPAKDDTASIFNQKQISSIAKRHYKTVIDGMEGVVTGGTARVAKVEGLDICGKTGTAENPHGEDHSLFIAFAPKNNPKIAVAVMVENAGFGSRYAAPISSLVIEKYLNKEISEERKFLEKKMLDADLVGHLKRYTIP